MKNIPERIYLQISNEDAEEFEDFNALEDSACDAVTWCTDRINSSDVEYVRQQSSWVSVGDGLPVIGAPLLVRCVEAHKIRYDLAIFTDNREFIDRYGVNLHNITHWMPIPECVK